MEKKFRMLVINPGSTSTKIAVFENTQQIFEKKLMHSAEEIGQFERVVDQYEFRKKNIIDAVNENNMDLSEFDAVMGRGGLTQPVVSGVYIINEKMLEQVKSCRYGEHAANLGPILASEIAGEYNIPSFIADPVVVDEMEDVARLSGIPQITRACIWHPLNQKSIARRAAKGLGKSYEECNFVGVHLGGGISVAAHKKGRAVDVNNALGGEGPYTPERAGGVPAHPLVELCYSGEYTKDEIRKLLVGKGGLTAYIGTNNGIEIEKMVNSGDEKAKLVFDGMCYQISKEIGAAATVLKGEVDAIFLTGGLAYNKSLVENIESMVKYICPVMVFPGEDEMLALAEAGLRVLTDVEKAKTI